MKKLLRGIISGFAILVAVGALLAAIQHRFEQGPLAMQCRADYFQCSASEAKICTPGTTATGCELVGTGKSDCNLVEDCTQWLMK